MGNNFFSFLKKPLTNAKPSDHFDGRRFFNPDGSQKKSFWHLLIWIFTRTRTTWPMVQRDAVRPSILPVKPDELKLTYVNHATILIQTPQLNVLTDPQWSLRASPFSWIGPKRVQTPGIPISELPIIHVILISHNHYDHLDLPTLKNLQKFFAPVFIVPLGNRNLLEKNGLKRIIEMDWWDQEKFKDVVITFMPAKHWSARWLHDKYRTLWGSYGIEFANKKIYFAGDTGYGKHFQFIKERWGSPEVALLPIGSYEPRWFMKASHLNPEEAVLAHLDIGAKQSIGIHFGFWQLSDEPFDQPVKDLNVAIKKYQLSPQTFYTLKPGWNVTI